jgi:hypothetical protein
MLENSMIVYKTENKINGKVYIGKTSKTKVVFREREHYKMALKNGSNSYFHKAIRDSLLEYNKNKKNIIKDIYE